MGDIITKVVDLPYRVRGFSTIDHDGNYTVFINGKLSIEMQREVYLHEINHIKKNHFEYYLDVAALERR